jgi:hypothetical protein
LQKYTVITIVTGVIIMNGMNTRTALIATGLWKSGVSNGIGSIEGLRPSSSGSIGVGATSIPIGDKGNSTGLHAVDYAMAFGATHLTS